MNRFEKVFEADPWSLAVLKPVGILIGILPEQVEEVCVEKAKADPLHLDPHS